MTTLHGFWMNCLHCPIVFIVGVSIVVVACSALLVSAAAVCCKGQEQRQRSQPKTMQNTSGCETDVLHVVF